MRSGFDEAVHLFRHEKVASFVVLEQLYRTGSERN